jgi:hypothetical protein
MKKLKTLFVVALITLMTMPVGAAEMTVSDMLDSIQIHGFVSQGFMQSNHGQDFLIDDSHKGSFEFNEMAINFSSQLSDNLSLGMQLFGYDVGENGNDEVDVDWAFGDYAFRDYLGFRGGIMKIPFGLYNETRKLDMVHTSILLPTSVYPEWFRESFSRIKGGGIYGELPGGFSYQALAGTSPFEEEGGLADAFESLMADLGMEVTSSDQDYTYTGQLQWESPFGLKLSASMFSMNNPELTMTSDLPLPPEFTGGLGLTTPLRADVEFEPFEVRVLSAEYMTGPLTLAAEYIEYDLDFTINISSIMDPATFALFPIPPRIDIDTTMQGYYGGAAYRVLDRLEVGAYYSEMYYDKHDKDGDDFVQTYPDKPRWGAWLKDTCLSARYDFSRNWCAKIEGHIMDGTFMALEDVARDWNLYAAKVTYNF